uniref:SBF1/SBF2 domain-containing protein n=1 Tax=Sinocyclocheilus anshuiensis TaxID=1608454 RepID=A0A671RWF3_9TELE
MEGAVVNNLIDFDSPPERTAPSVVGPPSGVGFFSSEPLVPEPASDATMEPLLPEPMAPTHTSHREEDSDATESADSDNEDTESPSHPSNTRRSSSCSSHSAEDAEETEIRAFMKTYVAKLFHGREDFDQEEKAHFGELCTGENGKGRDWFAKYVTIMKTQSLCHQVDDYGPAKHLMTMCFTYYYMGKSQLSPTELLERPSGGIDSYLRSGKVWLSGKKDIAERLLKNTSAKTEVKGFFGGLESKLRGPLGRKNEDTDKPAEQKTKTPVSPPLSPDRKEEEKIYLYTQLKQQPIWHTLRFWNAAFFDAVHCERNKRSPTTRRTAEEEKDEREKWCHMTQEEKDDSSRFNENITFGQLGTFTHNMVAFGLNKKLCNDFLKKQAVIGNLNEEQYKLLCDHIEQMAAE